MIQQFTLRGLDAFGIVLVEPNFSGEAAILRPESTDQRSRLGW